LAVGLRRVIEIAHKSVFILQSVARSGVGPATLRVVTLIFESGAIDVIHLVRRIVKRKAIGLNASRVTVNIAFVVTIAVVEAGQAMLPSGRRVDGEFRAAEQAIELGPLVGIGGNKSPVEASPFSRHSSEAIGVPHSQPER